MVADNDMMHTFQASTIVSVCTCTLLAGRIVQAFTFTRVVSARLSLFKSYTPCISLPVDAMMDLPRTPTVQPHTIMI